MPPVEDSGVVVARRDAGKGLFVLRVHTVISKECKPGEFVNIKIPSCGEDPFLRRPISVSWSEPDEDILELLIQVCGRGSRALSESAEGAVLSLLGPLGKGFPIEPGLTAILG